MKCQAQASACAPLSSIVSPFMPKRCLSLLCLATMGRVVPWAAVGAVIDLHCPYVVPKGDRPAIPRDTIGVKAPTMSSTCTNTVSPQLA
jgi:hypothetical protein